MTLELYRTYRMDDCKIKTRKGIRWPNKSSPRTKSPVLALKTSCYFHVFLIHVFFIGVDVVRLWRQRSLYLQTFPVGVVQLHCWVIGAITFTSCWRPALHWLLMYLIAVGVRNHEESFTSQHHPDPWKISSDSVHNTVVSQNWNPKKYNVFKPSCRSARGKKMEKGGNG